MAKDWLFGDAQLSRFIILIFQDVHWSLPDSGMTRTRRLCSHLWVYKMDRKHLEQYQFAFVLLSLVLCVGQVASFVLSNPLLTRQTFYITT